VAPVTVADALLQRDPALPQRLRRATGTTPLVEIADGHAQFGQRAGELRIVRRAHRWVLQVPRPAELGPLEDAVHARGVERHAQPEVDELDSMLAAVATARRAPTTCVCGAPQPWGSHFCANCGRPVGAEPVVACESCGHPLPADAKFCASCGHASPEEPDAEDDSAEDAAAVAASEEPEPAADPWER